ncbi:isopentenyl-diphosphate Delta-isomerase [Brevibacterium celere]|nr:MULTISPECIES: isopentenyl-diphosphate Delta-isomerase [Brevibacterium]
MTAEDHVILVDDDGETVGTAPRATVHTTRTPLHLAFSCYVLDDTGNLLVTRRSLAKTAWPGVWTNSFCGHPRIGETFEEAIDRYAEHELGVAVSEIRCVLPEFRYRAVDASGVVENEICPVYSANLRGTVRPRAAEVIDWRWVPFGEIAEVVRLAPWTVSPWMAAQVPDLAAVLARIRTSLGTDECSEESTDGPASTGERTAIGALS